VQTLITLPDGSQLAIHTGNDPTAAPDIHYRSSMGGSWSLPFESSAKPHVVRTYFVGEW
jgi:hypothetical protein